MMAHATETFNGNETNTIEQTMIFMHFNRFYWNWNQSTSLLCGCSHYLEVIKNRMQKNSLITSLEIGVIKHFPDSVILTQLLTVWMLSITLILNEKQGDRRCPKSQ
jgi:hypothetical protein